MNSKLNLLALSVMVFMSNVFADDDMCAQVMKMDVKKIIEFIQRDSVTAYLNTIGTCPCPYSYDSVYSKPCGNRSAYTINYGKYPRNPKCYPEDVNGVDIANFRAQICKIQKEQEEKKSENITNTQDTSSN